MVSQSKKSSKFKEEKKNEKDKIVEVKKNNIEEIIEITEDEEDEYLDDEIEGQIRDLILANGSQGEEFLEHVPQFVPIPSLEDSVGGVSSSTNGNGEEQDDFYKAVSGVSKSLYETDDKGYSSKTYSAENNIVAEGEVGMDSRSRESGLQTVGLVKSDYDDDKKEQRTERIYSTTTAPGKETEKEIEERLRKYR